MKLAGNDDEYEGRLEIPNLSDEFDSRELEVKFLKFFDIFLFEKFFSLIIFGAL